MALGVWQNVIQTGLGAPVIGATVTVLDSDTQEVLDLFSDRDGVNEISLPLLTDSFGFVRFYCRVGRVDISIVKGSALQLLQDVVIIDDFPG
jgi:hypothetical protein